MKTGRQKGGQDLSQGVNDAMRRVLRARTQKEHRKKLRAGIDGQPEPQHLCGAAQPRAQFVQLEMRKPEMTEEVFVQDLCMFPCARQPGGDGGLSKPKTRSAAEGSSPSESRSEHHGDLLRGGLQAIQGRVPPGSERGAARLTAKGLDALSLAVLAITNQRMNLSLGNAEVGALWVGAGVSLGVDPLGCSPAAFDLVPRAYWCWPSNRRGSGGETTGGAIVWGLWLEQTVHRGAHRSCCEAGRLKMEPAMTPKPGQSKDEGEHEQEHVNLKGHKDPRCLKSGA